MSHSVAAHRGGFVGSLLALLLLTACTGGSVNGPSEEKPLATVVRGTVQAWTEGRATVRAFTGDYDRVYRDVPLAEGALGTDGSFTLTLPPASDIPSEVVYAAKSLFSCRQGETGSVEVVPEDLDYVYLEAFAVFLPDTDLNREGDLEYSAYDADIDAIQNVVYIYATADGTVRGRCETSAGDDEGGYDTSNSYDLTLTEGWNEATATNVDSPRSVTSSLQTGPLPEGFTWQYLDYSDLPNDGPPPPTSTVGTN